MILMMAVLNPTQEGRRAQAREGNTSEWLIRLITWQEFSFFFFLVLLLFSPASFSPPSLQYCDCEDVVQWSNMKRLWRPRTTLRDKIIPKTKEQRDCLSTPPGGNWDAASFLSRWRENKTDRPRSLLSKGWCSFVSMQMVLRKQTKTKGRLLAVLFFFFFLEGNGGLLFCFFHWRFSFCKSVLS